MRYDLVGFSDLQNLDVAVLQLHNTVVSAPWMTVAAADGKPGADIELRGRVKVADSVHDVIDTMGHRAIPGPATDHFTEENAVGTSN